MIWNRIALQVLCWSTLYEPFFNLDKLRTTAHCMNVFEGSALVVEDHLMGNVQ
jgi:hypothetical protein